MLFDTHCHLDYFEDLEREKIIKAAFSEGIGRMVTICTKLNQMDKILEIANSNPNIFCSLGNHPDEAHLQDLPHLNKYLPLCLANKEKIVAIGETGLDYYRTTEHKSVQIEQFEAHIELAAAANLTVVVHTRNADDDTLNIIERNKDRARFIMHCFTGSQSFATKLLNAGCYISISGIVTFKNATEIAAMAQQIPLDRLLIETDSPFLAPVPHRGSKNQPAYVKHVAQHLCNLHKIDYDELLKILWNNSSKVFGIKI